MSPSGSLHHQGPATSRKNAPASRKKSSGQPAGFTFVDQSADLRSIADKKIVDSDQRHLIRSHVMQKVRKDERLLGKKRPTGREGSRKGFSSHAPSAAPTAPSTPRSEVLNFSPISPLGSEIPSTVARRRQSETVPRSPSPGRLDPFNTLPGGRELSRTVDELVQYCFHKFIPMTFPIVASTPTEYNNWRLKILKSQTANTATFFGMMATLAAHQAITNGRHKDLRPSSSHERPSDLLIDNDFAMMKSHALQATQERISRNGWDGPTVEAIFSLIGAEQILGNFEEARFHLSALKKFFISTNGLDPTSPASDWIPLTDVKGAIGTMRRPLFRLPWNPEPVPQDLIDKLQREQLPQLSMLGTSFSLVNDISQQLLTILEQATMICRFCQFNALHSKDLTATEYEIFRCKTLELEYDVLSYIYPGSPTDEVQTPNKINVVEQMARLAVLGLVSSNITKLLTSSGVGRALTHFQNLATQEFYASLRRPPGQATAQFVMWALLIFTQCARGQPERRFFVNSLARYSSWAGIHDWASLENACSTFLYVPIFQQGVWREIWSLVGQIRQTERTPQRVTRPHPQTYPIATTATTTASNTASLSHSTTESL